MNAPLHFLLLLLPGSVLAAAGFDAKPLQPFFDSRCVSCPDAAEKKGGLDLDALKPDLDNAEDDLAAAESGGVSAHGQGSAAGRGAAAADAATAFQSRVQPLLKNFCMECHGDRKPKAGVNLSGAQTLEQLSVNRDWWLRALEQIEAGNHAAGE